MPHTTATQSPTLTGGKLSPLLRDRIERLAGCQGTWFIDCRDSDWRAYDVHTLPYLFPHPNFDPERVGDPIRAAELIASKLWRGYRLLFSPDRLNGDCSWPGGYDAPAIYTSNARVFAAEFADELCRADGDFDGTALDVRYITGEMLASIEALEDYPAMDDADVSELELERQYEAWESWVETDWRRAIEAALDAYAPEDADAFWAEEKLEAVEPETLRGLFDACCEQSSTYWIEESGGQWIDLDRVATALDLTDLKDLTGLPLLHYGQQWRNEPYPWQGAEPSPLVPEVS